MPEIIIHSLFLKNNFNGRRVKEKALGQVFNKNRDIHLQISKILVSSGEKNAGSGLLYCNFGNDGMGLNRLNGLQLLMI
jgi:hypothetical protein